MEIAVHVQVVDTRLSLLPRGQCMRFLALLVLLLSLSLVLYSFMFLTYQTTAIMTECYMCVSGVEDNISSMNVQRVFMAEIVVGDMIRRITMGTQQNNKSS